MKLILKSIVLCLLVFNVYAEEERLLPVEIFMLGNNKVLPIDTETLEDIGLYDRFFSIALGQIKSDEGELNEALIMFNLGGLLEDDEELGEYFERALLLRTNIKASVDGKYLDVYFSPLNFVTVEGLAHRDINLIKSTEFDLFAVELNRDEYFHDKNMLNLVVNSISQKLTWVPTSRLKLFAKGHINMLSYKSISFEDDEGVKKEDEGLSWFDLDGEVGLTFELFNAEHTLSTGTQRRIVSKTTAAEDKDFVQYKLRINGNSYFVLKHIDESLWNDDFYEDEAGKSYRLKVEDERTEAYLMYNF
jgi:hypothetical protein